jgi:glycogen operon protein
MLSQGVPMLLHGDEVARTQRGNNNTYCQDNELSWQSWDLDERAQRMLAWVQRMVDFRRRHPVLRRRRFFQGRATRGSDTRDIIWYRPDGGEMGEDDWNNSETRALAFVLSGEAADLEDERGRMTRDRTIAVLMNSSAETVTYSLPRLPHRRKWTMEFDTDRPEIIDGHAVGQRAYEVQGRSLVALVASE